MADRSGDDGVGKNKVKRSITCLFFKTGLPLPMKGVFVTVGPSAAFQNQTTSINERIEDMEAQSSSSWIGTLFGSAIGLIVTVGIYVFVCYCLKVICEKAGHQPGVLIWIPIVNFIPLLTVAKLPLWFIILFLIPFVNFVMAIVLWAKLCQARGKSGWLAIMLFIPLVNLIFIPYLAFSE